MPTKKLVIVESPAKAKTIHKYLGSDYQVLASVGHVRDLPPKELGVDVEHDFAPTYQVTRGKGEVLKEIEEAARHADAVYLATDPDREGEAIAWHVAAAAHIDEAKTRRIAFDQVTKAAVQGALASPRDLDRHLIDAQQARRVLDRLVGYKISPLLSKALRRALSAGRVQSVALRLVVEREREIMAFVPQEYWTLDADLRRTIEGRETFRAHLLKVDGQEPGLSAKSDVDALLALLHKATYTVTDVQKGQRRRNPNPPFITTTLQAEAGSKLGYSPRQTMALAQQLYEGIDLEGERVGLITYMRTDSPHVAPEAQAEAREFVLKQWGAKYLPDRPPVYRARSASAQEAHEAIRPTSVLRTPDGVRQHLDARQARLYELIWRRFLASQMVPAVYDTMTVDITAATRFLFRANGRVLVFDGFLAVYDDGSDTEEAPALPPLTVNEVVDLVKLLPEQHFTQPPPRYSEPTLIKELEANGVGRPSTYASILSVIQDRGYVRRIGIRKQNRQLLPTPLGMIVCDALVDTFARVMDVGYTAEMEERLDRIASGDLGYVAMLSDFYGPFQSDLQAAAGRMPEAIRGALWRDLPADLHDRTCPQCGRPLEVRVSDAGRFLGCTGYPDCRYLLDLADQNPGNPTHPEEPKEQFAEGETCEKCGGRMKIIERGRDKFLGCENYPRCKNTRPILSERIKQLAQETACPHCGHRPLEARKGRYGEYLHCAACEKNVSLRQLSRGGEAGQAAAVETVDIPCPQCGARPLEKRVGRYGPYYHCPACNKNTSAR